MGREDPDGVKTEETEAGPGIDRLVGENPWAPMSIVP